MLLVILCLVYFEGMDGINASNGFIWTGYLHVDCLGGTIFTMENGACFSAVGFYLTYESTSRTHVDSQLNCIPGLPALQAIESEEIQVENHKNHTGFVMTFKQSFSCIYYNTKAWFVFRWECVYSAHSANLLRKKGEHYGCWGIHLDYSLCLLISIIESYVDWIMK